ncbi:MAG: hypothetical protein F7C07_08760 [Desulfurococcales archaeon]|nr:hypothetical protein [Desulfurococcales archaeon]
MAGAASGQFFILHGSALRSDKFRDVDLIVFADRHVEADDVALKVMEAIESVAGVEADVYVVNDFNEVDCFLLLEALRNGVIPYQEPLGRDMLVKSTGICVDFMISQREAQVHGNTGQKGARRCFTTGS